jgi:hypothetical protein
MKFRYEKSSNKTNEIPRQQWRGIFMPAFRHRRQFVAQKSGTTAGRKEKHPAAVPSKE